MIICAPVTHTLFLSLRVLTVLKETKVRMETLAHPGLGDPPDPQGSLVVKEALDCQVDKDPPDLLDHK